MKANISEHPRTAKIAVGKKHPLIMQARRAQPVTTQTDAGRQVYFRPELWKFRVTGLPLHAASCTTSLLSKGQLQGTQP